MAQTAAHLVDQVIPHVPVRQWVLPLPIPLHVLLAAQPDGDGEEARTLRPLEAAAITYRIAFGPRAGQQALTLHGGMPREAAARQPLCADIVGFSLQAAVRVEAHDRKRLEQLCRYITRPPCRPRPASGRDLREARTAHWTVCVRAQRCPTNGYSATLRGRWNSGS